MKSTYFGLLAEFDAAEIRLEDCCEKYFGLCIQKAKRRAIVRAAAEIGKGMSAEG